MNGQSITTMFEANSVSKLGRERYYLSEDCCVEIVPKEDDGYGDSAYAKPYKSVSITKDDQPFFVKVFNFPEDDKQKADLKKMAKAEWELLDHLAWNPAFGEPHECRIPKAIAFGFARSVKGERFAIAMEEADGQMLADMVRGHQFKDSAGGPLALGKICRVGANLAYGIEELTCKHGITHRDLSHRNVFVGSNEVVTIVDFGSAFSSGGMRTVTNDRLAAPHFGAPEVFNEDEELHQSDGQDVWSIGALLYYMSTQEIPHYGLFQNTSYEEIRRVKRDYPLDISKALADCPSIITEDDEELLMTLSGLVLECTMFNPLDRPHISDVRRRLNDLLRASNASTHAFLDEGESSKQRIYAEKGEGDRLGVRDLRRGGLDAAGSIVEQSDETEDNRLYLRPAPPELLTEQSDAIGDYELAELRAALEKIDESIESLDLESEVRSLQRKEHVISGSYDDRDDEFEDDERVDEGPTDLESAETQIHLDRSKSLAGDSQAKGGGSKGKKGIAILVCSLMALLTLCTIVMQGSQYVARIQVGSVNLMERPLQELAEEPGEWEKQLDGLSDGDVVQLQFEYVNSRGLYGDLISSFGSDSDISELTTENVMIRFELPDNMEYVEGSTWLYNSYYQEGVLLQEETATTSGVNIGAYKPGANAYIRIECRVKDVSLQEGESTLAVNARATANNTWKLPVVLEDNVEINVSKAA